MSCTVTPPLPFATTTPPPVTTGGGLVQPQPQSTPSSIPPGQAADGIAALAAAVANLATAVASLAAQLLGQQPAAAAGAPATGIVGGGANAAPSVELAASDRPHASARDRAPASDHASASDREPASNPAPATDRRPAQTPAATPVSGDVSKWVKGDLKGLDGGLLDRLAKVGERIGKPLTVVSGFRSRDEQQHLYDLYKAGKGNLAAKPGTSNHEKGNAADVNVDGTSLANNAKAKAAAFEFGLHFPVGGEPWHTEVK